MEILLGLFILTLYFIPTIIALGRNHRSELAIAAMNLILGWTVVCWIWALIWSLNGNVPERTPVHRQ